MSNSFTEVKIWLKNRNIVVPDDWLEACLNWVLEENRDGYLSPNRIKHNIYEQWLMADLQEIGSSCLPDVIFCNKKSTLHGTYTLQMLDILDVSQPCYCQLLKIHGKDSQNAAISADPGPTVLPWETKPKRMMMMTLTDGSRSLKAMEYKPIEILHYGLPPGRKVQISGPIECRLGILLMTAENIQVLGGEVESIMKENSNENVLLRKLGHNGFEDRYSHHSEEAQSFDSGIGTNSEMQHTANNTNSNLQHWNSLTTSRNSILLHRATNHKNMISLSNNTTDLTVLDATESFPDSTDKTASLDEFEDDDEFLNNLDYDHLDQLVLESSGTPSEKNSSEILLNNSSCKIRSPPPILDIPDGDLDDFA